MAEVSPENDVSPPTELIHVLYGVTTEPPDENILDSYPAVLLYFASFCCVLFITIGVPGNLLTILALTKAKKLHNATTAFIVNLSIADLMFCAFNLPLVISTFLHRGWVHGEWLCILFPFFRYSNVAVSLFSVLAITINRYVMIVHKDKYHSIYRPSTIGAMIICIWCVSFGTLVPTLFSLWGRFGFDPRVGTCSIISVDKKSPKTFLFVAAFALPCVVIILCYLRIFWIARQTQRRLRKKNSRSSRPNSTNHHHEQHREGDTRDMRLVKMIVVIFVAFVSCYLPVTIVKVFSKEEALPVTNICGYILIFMTSCTNPIIYVLMSTEYRRAYRNLFLCGHPLPPSATIPTHTSRL